MNYLMAVQDFIRTPIGSVFIGRQYSAGIDLIGPGVALKGTSLSQNIPNLVRS